MIGLKVVWHNTGENFKDFKTFKIYFKTHNLNAFFNILFVDAGMSFRRYLSGAAETLNV